ncbi:MAG TPA: carboxypeptidase regulatory-like domain-containing protein, partial [Longimicrobiales bacterium]|nr:carboxypeptidase regulatory-like domain-containing protein [Longimicrobiales bacterium]
MPLRFSFAAKAFPLIIPSLLLPEAAQAQTGSTLGGRVIAQGTGEPIEAARVDLDGRAAMLTDSDGAFRFINVPRGRVTLRVAAFGYADSELTFEVLRDTAVVIVLADVPIAVDSLLVTVRRISVEGRVIDAVKRLAVDARVFVVPGEESTTTNGTGRYGFDDVSVGDGSF